MDIDEGSITKNPIVINKIEIIAPEITYEKISGSDNFQAILKNVQTSAKAEKKSKGQASSDGDKQGKKIVINNVIVKDGKVHLTMAALGGKEITAPLPNIHLKDIGKEKNGATPLDVSGLQTGGDTAKKAADSATEGVKSATEGLKSLFKKD